MAPGIACDATIGWHWQSVAANVRHEKGWNFVPTLAVDEGLDWEAAKLFRLAYSDV